MPLKGMAGKKKGGKGEEDLVSRPVGQASLPNPPSAKNVPSLLRPSINIMTKRATGSGVEYWVTRLLEGEIFSCGQEPVKA